MLKIIIQKMVRATSKTVTYLKKNKISAPLGKDVVHCCSP